MKTLSKNNAKKGDKVILVKPYNHHFGCTRNPNKQDVYWVRTRYIHSIGKIELKLVDETGNPHGEAYYSNTYGDFLATDKVSMFVCDESDIENKIEELRAVDEYSTENYSVRYEN